MEINREDYIQKHMPFIIKVVSDFTKRYVEIENSEELSIALEAFHHAMEHFDETKGTFFAFAKKVMVNKLIDAKRKQGNIIYLDIDEIEKCSEESIEEQIILREELFNYEKLLSHYGFDFEVLTKHAPKHQDTRVEVLALGIHLAKKKTIVDLVVQSKRLPLTRIIQEENISLRFLKSHQKMILAIIIAYQYQIQSITDWIEEIYERSCQK